MIRGRWIYDRARGELVPADEYRASKTKGVAASSLPRPMIISDIMPETEHIDGRFYTSKSAFRRVTKQEGCIEVGNEKLLPAKPKGPDRRAIREALRRAKTRLN